MCVVHFPHSTNHSVILHNYLTYCIRFNFRRVKLSQFESFCVFTFAVAESQAGEIKLCVSFRGVKLSQVVADPAKV